MERLLTVSEVAKALKVSKNTVYALQRNGLIRFLKLGALKCRESELDRFIREAEGKDFSDLSNIKEL